MTNPTDKIKNTSTYRVTEGIVSASNTPLTLDTGNAEMIELVNKGPNTIFFRTDGTTPTVGVTGNADHGASGSRLIIKNPPTANVKILCNSAEPAPVYYRLYS